MNGIQIFISAVSNEFGSYRSHLHRYLERYNVAVKIQEHMGGSGVETINQLANYVKSSDGIVHLVGDQTGSPINTSSLAWLQQHYPKLAADFPPLREVLYGSVTASYTQWEAYLALVYGKELLVTQATEAAPRDNQPKETAPVQSQETHLHRLRSLGRYSSPFYNADNLIAVVVASTLFDLLRKNPRINYQNLPYTRLGPLFKGRVPVMQALRATFLDPASGDCKGLRGMGGIGKTRLAVEYAWQHQHDYIALLFVTADTLANLTANLARLSGLLVPDLQGAIAQEQAVRQQAVLDWLARHPGWLLILDNVDSPEVAASVEKLLPQLAMGHVLLTTRIQSWSPQVECLDVDVLSEEDATAFLLERTASSRRPNPDDPAEALALARDLGQLALALEQAGAYITYQRSSLEAYRQRWAKNEKDVRGWFNEQLMHYPRSVAITWQTSFAQLSNVGRTLLSRLAWLAPTPVPLSLLDVPVPDTEPLDNEEAIAELANYSLATYTADGMAFSIHLLVQDVTRRSLELVRAVAFQEALNWVSEACVGSPKDVRTWPMLEPLQPHALAVAQEYAPEFGNPEPTAHILNQMGLLLKAKADWKAAELLLRSALAIREASFGASHPVVVGIINSLALLLKELYRNTEAEPYYRRALAIQEVTYGSSHPEIATNLNNLGVLLHITSRNAEAESIIRRALIISEASNGPDHHKVATSLNNLGSLLTDTNRAAEAEPLLYRALAIDEASYGLNHPEVATDLDSLALLLEKTGRVIEAESFCRRALTIRETSYGPTHPTVAVSLNHLSRLLHNTQRAAEAEPLLRRALAIDEASYGPSHPIVSNRLNNLVELLLTMNRMEEAEPLLWRLLAIQEAAHNPNHTKVLKAIKSLGWLLLSMNRNIEAKSLYQRALVIEEAAFGFDHPSMTTTINNLAVALEKTNQAEKAALLYRRALAIFVALYRSTGQQHADLQMAIDNYTRLMHRRGYSRKKIITILQELGVLIKSTNTFTTGIYASLFGKSLTGRG